VAEAIRRRYPNEKLPDSVQAVHKVCHSGS
jgi:hypothetical protein